MSFPEVLAAARALPRAEKLQLMHALVDDVGGEEASAQPTDAEADLLKKYFPPGATLEIHTPLECYAAAAALEELLKQEKAKG